MIMMEDKASAVTTTNLCEGDLKKCNNLEITDLEQNSSTRRELPSRKAKDKFYDILKSIDLKSESDLINVINVQKNKKFKSSNLETIFEEPFVKGKKVCFIGQRKLRRCIFLSDGLNFNKRTIKTRRDRIRKFFGRKAVRSKITKIMLDDVRSKLDLDNTNDYSDSTFSSGGDLDCDVSKQPDTDPILSYN